MEMGEVPVIRAQPSQPACLGSAQWLIGCVTMGKGLDFPVPLDPLWQNGSCY